jgi:hypothetical protein
MTPSGFLFCLLLYSVLYPYLVLCFDCPSFWLLSLLIRHNTDSHTPARICILSLHCIRTSLSRLSWLLPFVLTPQHTNNSNIHALGEIRTRNSSNRAATDLRLRPRSHRDWQEIKPATFRLVAHCSILHPRIFQYLLQSDIAIVNTQFLC